jgi:Flp pilus assembly protein TadD
MAFMSLTVARHRLIIVVALGILTAPLAAAAQQTGAGARPLGEPHARAQRFLYSGQLQRAVSVWESALKDDADNREMLAALGATLYADGQSSQAVPYLRRAVALDPRDWTLRLFLGTVLHAAGDQAQAAIEFQAVVSGAPNPGTVQIASDKLAGRFFRDQAVAEKDIWAKIGTQREPDRLWIGRLVTISWAKPQASLHDDGSLPPLLAAAAASRLGGVYTGGDGFTLYGRIGLRAISYAKHRYLFAVGAWKGTPEEGHAGRLALYSRFFAFVLEHVRTGSPQAAGALKMQARTAISQRKYADAVELTKGALQSAPDDPEAHQILGSLYTDLGQTGAASKELEAALARWPDYSAAHHELGRLRLKQGRPREALAAFMKAIELEPTNVATCLGLVAAYRALGERLSAESAIDCAKEIDPHLRIAPEPVR